MRLFNALHHPHAGAVLLRTVLALLILLHGWAKITGGVGWIAGMLQGHGLPGYLAYAVYLGEVVAPLLMLVGVWVAPAALVVAINMLVALFLVHQGHFFSINKSGGWELELQAMFLVGALVVAMTARPGK
ncbi:DoxX family protein [Comamonas faecalis]|uniref:DoxX family protein n=1 Tax=Comamonas faecalis TaxID=1387849 RepID=A0ABP7QJX2_9BURK